MKIMASQLAMNKLPGKSGSQKVVDSGRVGGPVG